MAMKFSVNLFGIIVQVTHMDFPNCCHLNTTVELCFILVHSLQVNFKFGKLGRSFLTNLHGHTYPHMLYLCMHGLYFYHVMYLILTSIAFDL